MVGIILAGGYGTRVYPCTKVVSKQLLPVYDKPTIYYPLSTLIKLGIKDILIISNKTADIFSLLNTGKHLGLNITYETQNQPRGIAEALIIGEKFIGKNDVVLALGDNIFTGINYKKQSGATIVGYKVRNPQEYGVVEIGENNIVTSIEEKPKQPKSDIAVTGLYFYDNTAPARAKKLQQSSRGELEITDLNKSYLETGDLNLSILNEEHAWFDTGNPDDLFSASMYIKSIQDRTNTMIGCIEGESYKQGFISDTEFHDLIVNMPKCLYRNSVINSYKILD